MRSTTWITAGFAQKYAGENGANFTCEWSLKDITFSARLTSSRLRGTEEIPQRKP
jgi:hypothetical protein